MTPGPKSNIQNLPHIEATWQLKRGDPHVKGLVLTVQYDVSYTAQAFEAGAVGYVLKRSPAAELLTAIGEVMRGRIYVTPHLANDISSA